MPETATQVICIQPVSAVKRCDRAFEVTFEGGLKALLPADHPDREIILLEIDRSLRHHHPAGVLVDQTGWIVDLRYAIQTSVRRVANDQENPNRLEIGFWGYSPVCYLAHDHPEFERIRTTLEQAVASDGLVWLAPRSWPVESDTESMIMDVRPVNRDAAPSQANGTG